MLKFTKRITCIDLESFQCTKKIMDAIELKVRKRLHANSKTDTVEGHISIDHTPNNHTIWVFLYDNNGIHESESHGKKRTRTNQPRIKKFVGRMPTKTALENII